MFLLILLGVLVVGSIHAQNTSPYHMAFKRDVTYLGGGVVVTGLGYFLRTTTADLTISQLDLEEINRFDKIATTYSSKSAAKLSNVALCTSLLAPMLLLSGRETRHNFDRISLLFVETMLLNQGITEVIKSSVLRPRPYVSDGRLDPNTVLSSNDRASFLSGHTASSAASTFFAAKVYCDYFPHSKLKPYVWGLASVYPAFTGYLRVRSGKHFPTDVVAGYFLGAGIGLLIPSLHKKKIKVKDLKIDVGLSSLSLAYRI
jgi:membrane-associated phospholipid phosphatase